jgi:hypothetical protein
MRGERRSPQTGDVVRLKAGFDHSFEGFGARRAGLPLREGALYQVIGLDRLAPGPVLTLCEVGVVHINGARHLAKVGSEQFPYLSDKFELFYMARRH